MASAKAKAQILRKLQSDLNAAIDSQVECIEDGRDDSIPVQEVSKAARQVLATVEDPIEKLLEIGFQVRLPSGMDRRR